MNQANHALNVNSYFNISSSMHSDPICKERLFPMPISLSCLGKQPHAAIPAHEGPHNKNEGRMKREKQRKCKWCGEMFEPSCFNTHHQKYCTGEDCKEERKHLRQNTWCHDKRLNDEEWRQTTDKRGAAYHRKKREQKKAEADATRKMELEANLSEELRKARFFGLLSYVANTKDNKKIELLSSEDLGVDSMLAMESGPFEEASNDRVGSRGNGA